MISFSFFLRVYGERETEPDEKPGIDLPRERLFALEILLSLLP
jgi:hypothetical protein